ncbi:MAG: hypothetical protein J6B23_05480 [Clostridia bacterium]|nr:hypothetical protein [Clostridia bacterium]
MKKHIFKVLLVVLIVYVVYSVINIYNSTERTLIAQIETFEKTYEFDAIITRNEFLISADVDAEGVLDPAVSENEMVKKGKIVAVYYDSTIDEETRTRLADINKRINEINSSPNDVSILDSNPDKIDDEIKKRVDDIITASHNRDMNAVNTARLDASLLIDRKLELEGNTEIKADTLEDLRAEKVRLERSYGGRKTEIVSPSHGVFSTTLDGYEEILTSEKALSMTVSDYDTAKKKAVSSEEAIKNGVVCKIIDNSKWWISIVADEQTASEFKTGDTVKIRFSGENKDIRATIEYISTPQSGKYIITMSSIAFSNYIMSNRFTSLTLVKNSYTGYSVPLEAIRVKDGKAGVYVKTENTVRYREIEVLYKDEKKAIIKADNTKSNALLLYDEIIIDMKE